jgi:gliding-associated putative ABC transporter substrate-binding component GldG
MRWLVESLAAILLLIGLGWLGKRYFFRIDLTSDQRYTLSPGTQKLLKQLPQAVYVTVYLSGEFPYPIERFRRAVETTLAELRAQSRQPLNYTFVNPAKSPQLLKQLKERGIQPIPINVRVSQTETRRQYMYPLAIVQSGSAELWIDLVKGNLYPNGQIDLLEAEQDIEHKFAVALRQIATYGDRPIVAFLKGHGEYGEADLKLFRSELSKFYRLIDARVREGQAIAPAKAFLPETLGRRLSGDGIAVLIVAGPDSAFTEREKYEIEQYLLRGGRIVWLLDQQRINLSESSTLTQLRELNLDDLFFRWGWRPGYDLVQDLSCGFIEVIRGYYNGPLWGTEKWPYYPIVYIFPPHPISRGVDALLLRYVGSLDTIAREGLRHTILAVSSPLSRSIKGTQLIDLNLFAKSPPQPEQFRGKGFRPVAILTEGRFVSIFRDREVPIDAQAPQPPTARFLPASGVEGKVLWVADGEIALPAEVQGRAADYLPLDNLAFLLNCVDYLAGEISLTEVRSRKVEMRRLNPDFLRRYTLLIQAVNLAGPLLLMIVMGLSLYFWRRYRYQKPLT